MGVADAQPEQHPIRAAFVEPFGAGEQQLADPIQRVGLAATVAERLVLHPAADLIDAAVADPHDVERVSDTAGVIEVRGQPGTERLGQIGGHHLDPRQPGRVGVGGPSPQVSSAVAFDHVDHDVPLEIDQPGRVDGGVVAVGGQERRLVDPELTHRDRCGRGRRRAGCRAR